MALPNSKNIEIPILHELAAVGGTDDLRFLYERLTSYFFSLSDAEISEIKIGANKRWRKAVQKAGKSLDENKFISRNRGIWEITEKGLKRVNAENVGFSVSKINDQPLSHGDIQTMLVEIGEILNFSCETEFEYYDVVWRENQNSRRLSHVFEVQSKGNLDSAFAKLKRAYDAQRSKPFLILANERDTKRALQSLAREFRELENVISILSFVEIGQVHKNLNDIRKILPNLLNV